MEHRNVQQLTVLNRYYLPDASRFLSAGSAGKRVFGRTPKRAAKRSVRASAASVVICLSTCDTNRTHRISILRSEQLPGHRDSTLTTQPAWLSIPEPGNGLDGRECQVRLHCCPIAQRHAWPAEESHVGVKRSLTHLYVAGKARDCSQGTLKLSRLLRWAKQKLQHGFGPHVA